MGSITDLSDMVEACRDVDAVVHLAGQAAECTLDDVGVSDVGV